MWVVKLGGSLLNDPLLIDWLQTIQNASIPVVVVPGGGVFADQVRLQQTRWRFDDRTAHQMALLAMQQYGLLLQGLNGVFTCVDSIQQLKASSPECGNYIWLPVVGELDADGIAASWDISSDSLAVWLARQLDAQIVVLVKSVDASVVENNSLDLLAKMGVIDKAFCDFAAALSIELKLLGKSDLQGFQGLVDMV